MPTAQHIVRHARDLPEAFTEAIDVVAAMEAYERRGWSGQVVNGCHVAIWLVALGIEQMAGKVSVGHDGEPCPCRRSRIMERACEFLDDMDVHYLVRTSTRADCGAWDVRGRIWVFATATGLAMGAWGSAVDGPAPYEAFFPYHDIHNFLYNDITGELLVEVSLFTDIPALKMGPLDGYQLVSQIRKGKELDD